MSKVVNLIKLKEPLLQRVKSELADDEFVDLSRQAYTAAQIADAEIILGYSPAVAVALKSPNQIRWIQAFSAGVDNFPLAELKRQNIYLTTASGANAQSVAQQAVGYLLADVRHLQSDAEHRLSKEWTDLFHRTELTGRRVLIMGTGNIGRILAGYLRAFEMHTVGISRSGRATKNFDEVATMAKLPEMLPSADYVINCLPLTSETRGLVNQDFLSKMAKSAYYVNVGRGGTDVDQDVYQALANKTIRGAALDVFNTEPLSQDSPLWTLPNVMITPHTAGHTNFYYARIFDYFFENLAAYKQGLKPTRNLINYDKGY
ncbi:D-2-hydroxyacid dehydrogenase [Lapidilactobacillus bayanensis]|uniref:D-2-hydroxyacid dehydrogenase n=1 Tax=Lapidilactobacillus bayanensis TaxID=2485998 RepID=UPI0013DE6297|nr:D-2-hydroxyacid dehydrogenase [Lapidilactobacillus bayanensis]